MDTKGFPTIGEYVEVYKQELLEWIEQQWDKEVKDRPVWNACVSAIDKHYRLIYKHISGKELLRKGSLIDV